MHVERVVVQRYRLESQVGRGGMGVVWRARDEVLGRDVAIKEMLLPAALSEAERELAYRRTLREARSAAQLSHPGVVTVHDVVEEDGRPWIVMELLRARSLQEVIDKEGPLTPERVAVIGRQVITALDAAHAVGVLHRDVKPSNVLLAAGDRVVLTDFGISHVQGDSALTQTGQMLGSPGYIAPERIRGQQAMPASDLWSLGVTLYAAVEGQAPFNRPDPMSTLAAVLTTDPPPAVKAGPLRPLIEGLLNKEPGERLTAATATAMLPPLTDPRPATTPPARADVTQDIRTQPTGLAPRIPDSTRQWAPRQEGSPRRSSAGLAAYASGAAMLASTALGVASLLRNSMADGKPPVAHWFSSWGLVFLLVVVLSHIPVVLSEVVRRESPDRHRMMRLGSVVGVGAALAQIGLYSVVLWGGYELYDQVLDEWAIALSGAVWGSWMLVVGALVWRHSRAGATAGLLAGISHILCVFPGGDGVPQFLPLLFLAATQTSGSAVFLLPELIGALGYAAWAILIGRWLRRPQG